MFLSKIRVMAGLLALSAASVAPAAAQEPEAEAPEVDPVENAIAFAKALTDGATAALTDDEKSESERLSAFQEVLADGLALEVIGKFMLGENRKSMSEAQLERYNAVFPNYITKQYAEQFADIVGRPLEVREAKAFGKRDVIVRTQFNRDDGDPILVDWRVRQLKSGGQKMIDIIVSGVSIMLVKREDFSGFIAANGIDALIEQLEQDAQA